MGKKPAKKAPRPKPTTGNRKPTGKDLVVQGKASPPAPIETAQPDSLGATGAGLPVRQAMRHMSKRVRLLQCTHDDLDHAVKFARDIMNNPKASRRDRIRSSELILAVSKQADDMAKALDRAEKDERLLLLSPTGGQTGSTTTEDGEEPAQGGAVVEVHFRARLK